MLGFSLCISHAIQARRERMLHFYFINIDLLLTLLLACSKKFIRFFSGIVENVSTEKKIIKWPGIIKETCHVISSFYDLSK